MLGDIDIFATQPASPTVSASIRAQDSAQSTPSSSNGRTFTNNIKQDSFQKNEFVSEFNCSFNKPS